jgi:hypothetical protein
MCSNESISCSFCNQQFSTSAEMGEHLIRCGNKTDQCPNCEKFIRRAIFAYHFENNCATLDEPTTSNNPKSNDKTDDIVYLPCQFCNQPIELNDYTSHQVKVVETFSFYIFI